MGGVPPIGFPPAPFPADEMPGGSIGYDFVREGARLWSGGKYYPVLDRIPNPYSATFGLSVRTIGLNNPFDIPPSLEIVAQFRIQSKMNASVAVGTNEFGGAWGYNLYQYIWAHSRIIFDPTNGVPLSIVDTNLDGRNVKAQYGTLISGSENSPLSATETFEGEAFGKWTSPVLRWPMWEISGANFRFFGQNWIRLIKVSGP